MTCVMFVGAHADDIELGAGGTCAKLAAAGYDVHILVMTDEADPKTAATRRAEAKTAAVELGVDPAHVYCLGLPDRGVACERASVGALRKLITSTGVYPIAVFTHSERDSHNDHVETLKIVKGALRNTLILKYQVRNSAILSGFRPSVHSIVDDFNERKSRALLAHASQVMAGRIPMDKVERFAERYAVRSQGRFWEAFELEIQEGAGRHLPFLNDIASSSFDRFWTPLLARERLTIVAPPQDARGVTSLTKKVLAVEGASDLALVSHLQGRFFNWHPALLGLAPQTVVEVTEITRAQDTADALRGHTVVLGAPWRNPAAAMLVSSLPNLRLRFEWAQCGSHEPAILDGHTGRPLNLPDGGREHGLVTLALNPFSARSKGPRYVVWVAGRNRAGLKAATHSLLEPERLGALMEGAERVFGGLQTSMQWVVSSNADGTGVRARDIKGYAPLIASSQRKARPEQAMADSALLSLMSEG